MDLDFRPKSLGKGSTLPFRRSIGASGVEQAHQRAGIDAAGIEMGGLCGRQVDPVGDVAVACSEVILTVIHDRASKVIRQEKSRPQTIVADNEVRLEFRSFSYLLGDGRTQLEVPPERLRLTESTLRSRSFGPATTFDGFPVWRASRAWVSGKLAQILNQEACTAATVAFMQFQPQTAKLSRKRLMNEKRHVSDSITAFSVRELSK